MSDPTVVTDREDYREAVVAAPTGARVPVELRVPVDDPFAAYRRARDGPGGAYLETTGGQRGWGYFAVEPIERLTVGSELTARESVTSERSDTRSVSNGSPTLGALQDRLDSETLVRAGCSVPYPCGAIGWLSYDVARELETLPSSAVDDRELPRLQVALFDRMAAWREPRDSPTELHVTACPTVPPDPDPDALYDRAEAHANALIERIEQGDPSIGAPPIQTEEATFESDCGKDAFTDRVRQVKQYVRDGDTFQTNVSQRLTAPAAVHPVAAFDALRSVNPAPYSALLEYPAADLVSASPELLLDRDGDRVVTEPIAGTRPRGATDEEDRALEAELSDDEKERAEHAMLVDLERNDLGKVCEYGTVDVTEYRRVDRYSEVMHLVSLVEGRLRNGATLAEAVAAVFPGGTITGAPKPRTMEIIDELEATRRGPYTGSIGIFGFDERATLNIVIRTLVRHGDRYHLRVGAGIVHDSDPDDEYVETLDKARALVTAVDEALGRRVAMSIDGGEPP